jgi:hypothetical protein
LEKIQPSQPRHFNIRHQYVTTVMVDPVERGAGVRKRGDGKVLAQILDNDMLDEADDGGVVVYDQ